MLSFMLALLATFVVSLGARDQELIATFSNHQGGRPGLVLVALVSTLVSGIGAGWIAGHTAPLLALPARGMLVALVLALAGAEMLLTRRGNRPAEPTQSLGAFGLVLLARQLTDAARLMIFALAVSSPVSAFAVLGGLAGTCTAVVLGWIGSDRPPWAQSLFLRKSLGLVLIGIGAWLAIKS